MHKRYSYAYDVRYWSISDWSMAMKKITSTLLAAIGAVGVLAFAASSADARTFHHHGGGGARVGVIIGAGIIASPWLYPRPYYYGPYGYGPYPYGPYYGPAYYPAVVEPPVVYTEQAQSAAPMAPPPAAAPQAQQQEQYWYFCQDTQTYYPHVQTCASPWQRVVPHAPR